uniref:(northern house mosquito) hypothetical protein n=1 Tax=Culex pipiens TaxID=7175 RepID=A0A8D8HD69_CULPI
MRSVLYINPTIFVIIFFGCSKPSSILLCLCALKLKQRLIIFYVSVQSAPNRATASMTQVNLFTAGAVIIIILLIYHYLAKKYHYFLPKPVPCLKPSFLVGSSGPVLLRRQGVTTFMKKVYNSFPDAKLVCY